MNGGTDAERLRPISEVMEKVLPKHWKDSTRIAMHAQLKRRQERGFMGAGKSIRKTAEEAGLSVGMVHKIKTATEALQNA